MPSTTASVWVQKHEHYHTYCNTLTQLIVETPPGQAALSQHSYRTIRRPTLLYGAWWFPSATFTTIMQMPILISHSAAPSVEETAQYGRQHRLLPLRWPNGSNGDTPPVGLCRPRHCTGMQSARLIRADSERCAGVRHCENTSVRTPVEADESIDTLGSAFALQGPRGPP